jgi:hypothetical protein
VSSDEFQKNIPETATKIKVKGGGQECPPYTCNLHTQFILAKNSLAWADILWETGWRSTETTMRTVRILSGIAVLLLTLHFTHVLHHFFIEAPHDSPVFWAGMVTAVAVWVLSFVGGCLLLKRSG